MEFLRQLYPTLEEVAAEPALFSPNTQRRIKKSVQIWDHFVATYAPNVTIPTNEDLVGFMAYRVGKPIPGDPYSAVLKLTTFTGTELNLLIHGLRARFAESFTLTYKSVTSHPLFRATIKEIQLLLGERAQYVHARPMWIQDEERLIQSTASCHWGLQERALIRTIVRTGARIRDIKDVDHRLQVVETQTTDGRPAIRIKVVSIKNQRGDVVETLIDGPAYLDLYAWLQKRRKIFPESPYLFVNSRGGQISAESISSSFATLSERAGYSPRFFSSHSGRMSFGCRLAASTLCAGGTMDDVYSRALQSGLWGPSSRSVKKYCDGRVSEYFATNSSMTWERFQQLEPIQMHRLSHLNPIMRKSAWWYVHPLDQLQAIATWLDITFNNADGQYKLRKKIVNKLLATDRSFKEWLPLVFPELHISVTHYMRVLIVLLDLELITVDFAFETLAPEQLNLIYSCLDFADLSQPPYDERERPWPFSEARMTREVRILNQSHEEMTRDVYSHRRNDRMLTFGRRPDHSTFVINANERERNTREYRILVNEERPDGHIYSQSAPEAAYYVGTLRKWIPQPNGERVSAISVDESVSSEGDVEPPELPVANDSSDLQSNEGDNVQGVPELDGNEGQSVDAMPITLPTTTAVDELLADSLEYIEIDLDSDDDQSAGNSSYETVVDLDSGADHREVIDLESDADSETNFESAMSEVSFPGFDFMDSEDESLAAGQRVQTPHPRRRLSFESIHESESVNEQITPPRQSTAATPSTSSSGPRSSRKP